MKPLNETELETILQGTIKGIPDTEKTETINIAFITHELLNQGYPHQKVVQAYRGMHPHTPLQTIVKGVAVGKTWYDHDIFNRYQQHEQLMNTPEGELN